MPEPTSPQPGPTPACKGVYDASLLRHTDRTHTLSTALRGPRGGQFRGSARRARTSSPRSALEGRGVAEGERGLSGCPSPSTCSTPEHTLLKHMPFPKQKEAASQPALCAQHRKLRLLGAAAVAWRGLAGPGGAGQ